MGCAKRNADAAVSGYFLMKWVLIMCKHGTTVPMPIRGKVQDIDSCIAPIVAALNAGGLITKASCCGHGNRPGNIALDDGRELMILPNFDAAREADKLYPFDIHGSPVNGDGK